MADAPVAKALAWRPRRAFAVSAEVVRPLGRPLGLFVGLSTVDVTYLVEAPPGRDEKVAATRQVVSAGGPATNAAAAFSVLGGRSRLMSAVGQHRLADIIHEDLRDLGISHVELLPARAGPPTISSIIVTSGSGDRAIVSLGAGTTDVTELEPSSADVDGCGCVLVDGHEMRLSMDIARLARAAGVTVVVDAGSWKPGTAELLEHVTHAVCSSSFAPPGCRSTSDTMGYLRDRGVRHRAITRGDRPIIYAGPRGAGELEVPAVRQVVDTTGAGDIMHGALCYYLAAGEASFPDALARASAVAALKCQSLGTRGWLADWS